jgi:integrase
MPSVSVKFYLESKAKGDKKKLLPIFLYIRHKGNTIKIFTDRKCNWLSWDVDRCRANYKKDRNATELNGYLGELEEAARTLYNSNLRKNKLTSKDEFLRLVRQLNGGDLKDHSSVIRFAKDYLLKTNHAASTLKAYKTTLNILQDYSTKKRQLIMFNDIDLNFYDAFTTYMWKEKGFNDNTVGTRIKHLKSLMSQAFERDLHNNLNFKKKKFQVLRRDVDSIYLNEEELDKIYNLNLEEDSRLDKVRDAFMIACWTGLRFSDLARVSKDKFIFEDGIQLFKIETEKTGEIVKIPLSPRVKPILEKYNFNIPVPSNQKMNQYLKELGKLAGIEQEVEQSDIKGGKKIRKKFLKFDLITTHTARRSFASNLYLQGVPSISIMAITGHRTDKSFHAYIKLSHMEKIREIDAHFKKIHDRKLKIA